MLAADAARFLACQSDLPTFARSRHREKAHSRLSPQSVKTTFGVNGCRRGSFFHQDYLRLLHIATHGVQVFRPESFTPCAEPADLWTFGPATSASPPPYTWHSTNSGWTGKSLSSPSSWSAQPRESIYKTASTGPPTRGNQRAVPSLTFPRTRISPLIRVTVPHRRKRRRYQNATFPSTAHSHTPPYP